jgi:Bcr/CflA subfamily drug resistance transporter
MNTFKLYKPLGVLVLVACLGGFASDIYTPSFLTMTQDLAGSLSAIQRSMSLYMLCLALSQLFYGPLSEILGRRMPLLIGLAIMAIGSVICAYATSINGLMAGRLIQGIGAGAPACLWRSIFRDIFNGEQIARFGGYVGIALVYIVSAAPFLGGYFEVHWTWRASFVAVMAYALLVLGLVYAVLPETSMHHSKDRMSIKFFKGAFTQLLTSPLFMGYSLCVFITYGAFFSWFVIGPVLLVGHFKLSPEEFGSVSLFLGGTAMASGGLFNGKMVKRLGQDNMLRLGWGLMALAGAMMMAVNPFFPDALMPVLVCLFIFLFGVTLIWPNAFAKAFAPFGAIAGCAAALYSALQLGGGALAGWISSFLPGHNPWTLPTVLVLASVTAWLLFELGVRKASAK